MDKIYDSREQWWQSNIYKKWNVCIKEYIWLTMQQLNNYLMLQSSFNWIVHNIDLNQPIKLDNKEIVWICLKFPHTNTQVFDMNWFPSTSTDYIQGQTFHDILQGNTVHWDFHSVLSIHNKITEYIQKSRSFNMDSKDFFSQIHEMNIKIMNYNNNSKILTLCITDIACTITEFLENNKILIRNIMWW